MKKKLYLYIIINVSFFNIINDFNKIIYIVENIVTKEIIILTAIINIDILIINNLYIFEK